MGDAQMGEGQMGTGSSITPPVTTLVIFDANMQGGMDAMDGGING